MKTTTKKVMALAAITSAILFSGCQKDLYDPDYVASKNGLLTGVPSDFNWSTISSVNLTVNVDDQFLGQYNYVVEVFDQNPIIDSNAKLLTKGLAKQDQAFITTFTIPQSLKTVYIRQTAPDGLKIVRSYDLSGSTLVCDFRSTSTKKVATKSVAIRSSIANDVKPTPSNAIEINSSTANPYTLTSGNSYVIKSGKKYTGFISNSGITGVKLYIEGEYNIQITNDKKQKWETGLEVIIQNGGKITFNNAATLNIIGDASLWVMQGGTFNATQAEGINIYQSNTGSLNNQGTIYANNITLPSSSTLNNTGTINASGTLTMNNSNCSLNNDGKLIIQKLDCDAAPKINNNCYFNIKGDADFAGAICNLGSNSYLGTKTMTCGTATTFNMSAYSILEATESAYFSSVDKIVGTGTGSNYAIAKLKKVTTGWDGITFSGNVEFESSDYPQNTQYNKYCTITTPAQTVEYGLPTVTIASDPDGCTGPGSTPITEPKTDTNYPLTVNLGTTYTYAMEDLWPNYGDYDMNDIVVAIKPEYTLSSAEYVQSMTFTTTLKAIGASKPLAAAIQLDNVSDANVSNVTYSVISTDGSVFAVGSNKVESFSNSENAKAVIPLFDNAHQFLGSTGITNTVKGSTTAPEKSVSITVTFVANKIKPSDISDIVTALNFFIVTDKQKTNRTEVHLRGFNATSHANKSLFGTGVDYSKTGLSYKSNSNLVWGMLIPTNFNYPVESTSILTAYPDFEKWAKSGGAENQTWYDTPETGTTF